MRFLSGINRCLFLNLIIAGLACMANLEFSMSAIAQDTVEQTLVQEPEEMPPLPLPTTPEPVMIPSSGGAGRFGQP